MKRDITLSLKSEYGTIIVTAPTLDEVFEKARTGYYLGVIVSDFEFMKQKVEKDGYSKEDANELFKERLKKRKI